MKNKLIYPIVVVVFAAACGGDGEDGKTVAGQQYETVQEGSAAGVTSSIAGPGETLPPITNTNADTTSAFALNPNALPMSPQPGPGAVAGTMPPPSQPVYSGGGTSPSYSPPSRSASPAPQRQAYVPQPMTSSSRPAPQQPAPAENTAPAPQQPAEQPAEEPAADTDTSATTNTAPPPPTNTAPPPAEKPQQEAPQQEEEPADEEPAEEPPPPPPAG